MTGWSDEVEHGVNSVVPEARITLDARLLRKLIVVLSFKETNNPREARMDLLVLLLVIVSCLYSQAYVLLTFPRYQFRLRIRACRRW